MQMFPPMRISRIALYTGLHFRPISMVVGALMLKRWIVKNGASEMIMVECVCVCYGYTVLYVKYVSKGNNQPTTLSLRPAHVVVAAKLASRLPTVFDFGFVVEGRPLISPLGIPDLWSPSSNATLYVPSAATASTIPA